MVHGSDVGWLWLDVFLALIVSSQTTLLLRLRQIGDLDQYFQKPLWVILMIYIEFVLGAITVDEV